MRYKLYTSQYNTTSQEQQVNYRNVFVYTVANSQIITQLKAQKQLTSIKQGLLIESESIFTSPIQYTQLDQTLERSNALQQIGTGAYNVAVIEIDEIIQFIQIQYPSLPQIFALVNSIVAFLMFFGFFGKIAFQNSIKKDFVMLFFEISAIELESKQLTQQQNNLLSEQSKRNSERGFINKEIKSCNQNLKTFQESEVSKRSQQNIIFLKKAVLMMLTQDQLAALQLISFSDEFIDKNQEYNCSTQQELENKFSYYEIQSLILQSSNLQEKFLQKFIQKCSYQQDLQKLDLRILSSIQKSNQN
ncbi:hypothetical protein ABPG72_011358 [Tetrahymena utriculariae]